MEKKYNVEKIEELKSKDPSELTPEERKIANLRPNKPGVTGEGHLGGRRKGSKAWATHFRKLMDDEKFLNTIISALPKQWDGVVDKYPASVIAAGLIATATQQVAKSIAEGKPVDESTLRIIDRISKIGYGETKNVNVDAEDDGFFEKVNFNFTVVNDREQPEES